MRRVLALLLSVVALSGCGFGAGSTQSSGGTLTVTRDFGESSLGRHGTGKVGESDTVVRLLRRDFDVDTRYGGNFVQEIDGVAGGRKGSRRVDWFYYVNGIEASNGAGERKVQTPATGSGGTTTTGARRCASRRWSARSRSRSSPASTAASSRCGSCASTPARRATRSRRGCRTPASTTPPARCSSSRRGARCCACSSGHGRRCARTPRRASSRAAPRPRACSRAPTSPGAGSTSSTSAGASRACSGRGGGLLAATQIEAQRPTWVVTGVDATGVAAAAAALTEDQLRDHFAIAVDEGRAVPLPILADDR